MVWLYLGASWTSLSLTILGDDLLFIYTMQFSEDSSPFGLADSFIRERLPSDELALLSIEAAALLCWTRPKRPILFISLWAVLLLVGVLEVCSTIGSIKLVISSMLMSGFEFSKGDVI